MILKPPKDYSCWLDYAIATMDTRNLAVAQNISSMGDEDGHNADDWGWPEGVTREDMWKSARAELCALKGKT